MNFALRVVERAFAVLLDISAYYLTIVVLVFILVLASCGHNPAYAQDDRTKTLTEFSFAYASAEKAERHCPSVAQPMRRVLTAYSVKLDGKLIQFVSSFDAAVGSSIVRNARLAVDADWRRPDSMKQNCAAFDAALTRLEQ